MAYLVTISTLSTHIYAETMNGVSRAQDIIVQTAIDRAISTAKGYLSRYDLVQLFGTPSVNPVLTDEALAGYVKDIALWFFIQLANPNIEMARAQTNYEYAIAWLRDIQKGRVVPEGWPYKEDGTDEQVPDSPDITANSNPKRKQYL